ncbi:MAG: Glucose-6-phosphate isomerase [Gammaproteobacteria bacterium]|nr:Glucose-6-phosphate isomerase [Gammaproteobacteria bacterium]
MALVEFINITPADSKCRELIARLRRRDTTLWSSDPDIQGKIENRLGWLDATTYMGRHSGRIIEFAEQIRAEGYQQTVLLGMGGSSLAPEVYAALIGAGSRSMALMVVDSTSPRYVRDVTEQCDNASTIFIVSSKSGTTAETRALEAHFFQWARSRFDRAQQQFIAITDPGSPLQSLAGERGYRETFLNPANIGGRFSALSFFGLVPAALAGADLKALREHMPDLSADSPLIVDACELGSAMGILCRRGKNKLTLHFSRSIAPVSAWIEQLIDESTGKSGTGLVVVPDEPRLAPDRYSTDRVFVVVECAGEPVDDAWVDQLAARGHPVMRWRMTGIDQLGAEFYKWEIATAIAGRELGINPFDEPDVNETKAMTRANLEQPRRGTSSSPQPPSALENLVNSARHGDYFAILAYLPPTPDNRRLLKDWGSRLTRHTGLPCCVGFGPRYLHSSGQLHKGGPDQGNFIVLTLDSDTDLSIPGQQHGFETLIQAQARGDLQVLKNRGRRVVHLQVNGQGVDLDSLTQTVP